MAGMFPTSFTGGVAGSLSVPYSYVLGPTSVQNGGAILFYGSSCVTLTQPQINALLAEFACIFDKTGWTYQPGASCNLWGALNKVFGSGEGGPIFPGVTSINGYTGPVVELTVSDIPGAAPLDSPRLTGQPSAPTQGPLRADDTLATTRWVRNAINSAVTDFTIPQATTTSYGTVILAELSDIAMGTPGKVVTSDQLMAGTTRIFDAFGVLIGHVYN